MTLYVYKAKQGPSKTVEGEMHADSRAAVMAQLDARGLIPISIEEKGVARAVRESKTLPGRRVRYQDVTLLTRQLAGLLKAGLPVLRALITVSDQTESPPLARVLRDVERNVTEGSMLSEALARHPSVFPGLYINMVRSGESAGILDTILLRLAEAREKDQETKRKVQTALAYPLMVLTVGAATVFVLLSFFLPRVIPLYRDQADLPMPTQILIGLTGFFSHSWMWILVLIGAGLFLLQRLAALEKGRLFFDRLILHTPLLGRFLIRQDLARFSRTLSLLLNAGLGIEKAITLSGETMANYVLRGEVEKIAVSTVRQGQTFSSGLARSRYFPKMLVNMAAVGEESGRLEDSLNEAAVFYEQEIDQQGKILTSLLEPILILAVGGIVGFIVAAMLLPIFKLSLQL
jgi:type II secretory pathway component PulF